MGGAPHVPGMVQGKASPSPVDRRRLDRVYAADCQYRALSRQKKSAIRTRKTDSNDKYRKEPVKWIR